MGRRAGWRMILTLLLAAVGASFLSGSGRSVTALPYPRWQQLAPPPFSAGPGTIGVRVGHRVLVLGGSSRARSGAAYDVRTGRWSRLRIPVAVASRDRAVVAAGVVVLWHRPVGRPASWWRYDVRAARWSRLLGVPPHLSAPAAYASAVYGLSRRRVEVYSVDLGRWTALPADPLRPLLAGSRVRASRTGTVVTGTAGPRAREVADRWDGLRWRRSSGDPVAGSRRQRGLPAGLPARAAVVVAIGRRVVVVGQGRAWVGAR